MTSIDNNNITDVDRENVLNINVGILGHVDSGKTSLVKALSTLLSTAALDKNPQSQQRGITLDLGFSSFLVPFPEHLRNSIESQNYDYLQFTLVDCPGHASLIRTIIGGAQIIDMMLLVVDANKGIQTQTAECIVLGEITTDKMIVILNKVDMIPDDEKETKIEKVKKRIQKVLSGTKFPNAPIVLTSASVGGEKVASIGATTWAAGGKNTSKTFINNGTSYGIDDLIEIIQREVRIPNRNVSGPLYYAIDHCFQIKGHGTVLTGTVLSGSVSINSVIEIPHLQIQKKVKSMQMFRKPVKAAKQGDRVGICVTNLDPTLIERAIAASPGSVPQISYAICMVKKVRFFRQKCKSNTKFHVSVGHSTVVANVTFFGASELASKLGLKLSTNKKEIENNDEFNDDYFNELIDKLNLDTSPESGNLSAALNSSYYKNFPDFNYDYDQQYEYQHEIVDVDGLSYGKQPVQWALLEFQNSVFCPVGSLIIGSKLDIDSKDGGAMAHQCRLAFFGPVKTYLTADDISKIRIFNWKQKEGEIFKITDKRNGISCEAIGWKLVQEGNSITPFINMKIETFNGSIGKIVATFGSDGKFRVKFHKGAKIEVGSKLALKFKRYIYDKQKVMVQESEEECNEPDLMSIYLTKDHNDDDIEDEIKFKKGKKKNIDKNEMNKANSQKNSVPITITNISTLNNDNNSNSNNNNNDTTTTTTTSNSNSNNDNVRLGLIESVKPKDSNNQYVCIVKNAFSMEENIKLHIGKKVIGPSGENGELLGPFAKLGKCKVVFNDLIETKCEDLNVQILL